MIGLQTRPKRHIAQGLVHGILRRCQQSGTRQLLIVLTILKVFDGSQHTGCLIDIAGLGIRSGQPAILIIGAIARHSLSRGTPDGIADGCVLTQVGQGDDVSGIRGRSGLIGHPDLHTANLDASGQVRQSRHGLIVMVTEIMGEEEVAVFLVVGHVELKCGGLCATLRGDGFSRRLLLREHCLEFKPAELHVGSETKEAAGALDERVVRGERHVSRFNEFDDLVFLALVFQFQVLCIEVEGGIGIVVQVHV